MGHCLVAIQARQFIMLVLLACFNSVAETSDRFAQYRLEVVRPRNSFTHQIFFDLMKMNNNLIIPIGIAQVIKAMTPGK